MNITWVTFNAAASMGLVSKILTTLTLNFIYIFNRKDFHSIMFTELASNIIIKNSTLTTSSIYIQHMRLEWVPSVCPVTCRF